MTTIIILYVIASITTIVMWILYTILVNNDPKDYKNYSLDLCLTIIATFITYGLFVTAILEAKKEVKTSVPAKVELVITEKQESGTENQIDTVYVYKFQLRKK